MMTAVGLTSEAILVSGGVINPKEDDLRRLHELLEKDLGLNGVAKERELYRIRSLTQQFVTDKRAAIEAVANGLLERKTLTGDEIDQLVKANT